MKAALIEHPRANKHGAKTTVLDGIKFDSKAESRRYADLLLLMRAGEITNLVLQPRFQLAESVVLGGRRKPAMHYTADFSYVDKAGRLVVEDVKGGKSTEAFRIRQHLMMSVHGIEVIEVRK